MVSGCAVWRVAAERCSACLVQVVAAWLGLVGPCFGALVAWWWVCCCTCGGVFGGLLFVSFVVYYFLNLMNHTSQPAVVVRKSVMRR